MHSRVYSNQRSDRFYLLLQSPITRRPALSIPTYSKPIEDSSNRLYGENVFSTSFPVANITSLKLIGEYTICTRSLESGRIGPSIQCNELKSPRVYLYKKILYIIHLVSES